jgi:hypothetical protein
MKNIHYPSETREVVRAAGWEYKQSACPIDDGDINMGTAGGYLSDAGYGSDLCIENEALSRYPAPERPEILRREAGYLKSLLHDMDG